MIDRLRGVVIDKGVDYLVLEVGGIGFRVQVPSFVWEQIIIGEEVALHTYLHVRDDAWTLYGFLTKEDLSLFMELIGVSGVGPRLGVKILSGTSPGQFRQAVVNGDVGALTLIPGIGKKTAQRIVLELGERLKKMGGAEDLAVPADSPVADALAALMALGYSRGEASAALQQAVAEQGQDGAEEIVRRALRHLL
ncbi:MAG: Holliday junction branch migration protein RuvA [Limnochordia bacterium]|nr:Holliday junction branch migration protein RuvA [Bacillota bacterium]